MYNCRIILPEYLRKGALLLLLALASVTAAADKNKERQLLNEEEYRSSLEEVVVVGQQPEWRKQSLEQEEWRPQRFELPEPKRKARIEWLPQYAKDERDQYDGVRDRTAENPAFKIFDWKF